MPTVATAPSTPGPPISPPSAPTSWPGSTSTSTTAARLDGVAAVLGLDDRERRRIEADTTRARLVQSTGRLHLTLEVLEPEADDGDGQLVRRELDLLAAPNLVVTVHRGPVGAIDRFRAAISGDSSLGVLDAGDLLSGLVDEVIAGYYGLAEGLELEIDRLDQVALRGGRVDVLAALVDMRRRIGLDPPGPGAPSRRLGRPGPSGDAAPSPISGGHGPGWWTGWREPSPPTTACATPCWAPTTSTWAGPRSGRMTS